MQNNRLRIMLALNMASVVLLGQFLFLLFKHIVDMLYFDTLNLFFDIVIRLLEMTVVNVLPLLLLFLLLIHIRLKPLQDVVNKLSAGEKCSTELINTARKRMITLSTYIYLFNILGFLLGLIIMQTISENGISWLFTPFGIFLFIKQIVFGYALASVQIGIKDLILAKPRQLLQIHYIDKSLEKKNLGLKIHLMKITLTLVLFAILQFQHSQIDINRVQAVYISTLEKGIAQGLNTEQIKKEIDRAIEKTYGDNPFLSIPVEGLKKINNMGKNYDVGKLLDNRSSYIFASLFFYLLTSFLIILPFAMGVSNQLKDVNSKMKDILEGEGDLTKRIDIISFDEVGELSDTINRFMENLRRILLQVKVSTDDVLDSSGKLDASLGDTSGVIEKIVASVEDVNMSMSEQNSVIEETKQKLSEILFSIDKISKNVSSQASFVDQTSSSIDEVVGSIDSVTQVTKEANTLSDQLVEVASEGRGAVDESIEAIKEIEEYSIKVNEIVQLISQIAQKTNMLAMNAAIEAAHAGTAGKGFAVVAEEVRKLAEDTDVGVKEIISHIETMTDKVDNGVTLTENVGVSLGKITEDINKTTAMIQQIANSMQEQNAGAQEVLSSVGSLVKSTHEIKDLAIEEKESSEEITKSMDKLVDVSHKVNEAVQKQVEGNTQIASMTGEIKEISKNNRDVVEGLKQAIDRFKLSDDDSDATEITTV